MFTVPPNEALAAMASRNSSSGDFLMRVRSQRGMKSATLGGRFPFGVCTAAIAAATSAAWTSPRAPPSGPEICS
ncbi:hypothetical protein ACH49_25955 [Streptomyces leeuwenhoekii]|uniref:Uncharacterized protein n=1 Tax=Streptomyces leeuwenhoekii TaxID=1437453 RepID=A0ABR5HSV0_STRLW|nr:hypothetical protein ACH49_25955 [Streptomyces leeuwenhoekii]